MMAMTAEEAIWERLKECTLGIILNRLMKT
jgi:hypothetical protein